MNTVLSSESAKPRSISLSTIVQLPETLKETSRRALHRDSGPQDSCQCKARSKQIPNPVITVSSARPSLPLWLFVMNEKTRQVVFRVVEAELRGSQRWDDWMSLSRARKERYGYGRREGICETSKQHNIATFYYGVSGSVAAVMSFRIEVKVLDSYQTIKPGCSTLLDCWCC